MSIQQSVYTFGLKQAEGDSSMKGILGGKGANLAGMCKIGLPVPPGFTICTHECLEFYKNNKSISKTLIEGIFDGVKFIEDGIGKKFGDVQNPLLVSVRSGAPVSMPGMMDTILNLGLNDETVEGLAKQSNNRRFAYDSYRRFIQMYANVVLGIDHHHFEEILESFKEENGLVNDADLGAELLENLVIEYKKTVKKCTNKDFPQDVKTQLIEAISAVFESWMNERAVYYRKINRISADLGTAVNIQSMVFGNLGESSGTGVAFTRDPSTGLNKLYGEYLLNAQGEDVVAGIRTPGPINKEGAAQNDSGLPSLEEVLPEVYEEFVKIAKILEENYKDMQDIEFTIENKKLFILQTRNGKRTAKAAIKIAVDMVNEGKIDKKTAILRVDAKSLDVLLHRTIDPKFKKNVIDKGLPASPGSASGVIVFSVPKVEEFNAKGIDTILVRIETDAKDIQGMFNSKGILTSRGGMTSHAAVVARGMGKPCVTSARNLVIDYKNSQIKIHDKVLKEGDLITIDGSTGEVFEGEIPTMEPAFFEEFKILMGWADELRTTKVRTNAETPMDAKVAVKFGCEGIGLCRTEHMFFDENRISSVREMILANNPDDRKKAINKLLPFQENDFFELFEIMDGLPVNIRLLDPPLHEFLPQKSEEISELANLLGVSIAKIEERIKELHEQNPMLGHRGCRLGITYPEIYEMQIRAIFNAGFKILEKTGKSPLIEIMIPLIISKEELDFFADMAKQINAEKNLPYTLGTMIEVPRAALLAGEIAKTAEYFSFGTNDLTQTTLGLSRDDAGSFLWDYEAKKILKNDPFQVLDREGVGALMKMAVEAGKATRPNIKLGICGEHGGEPESIHFCVQLGLSYVSCSPYRIPIARLAAAQAEILLKKS
jgi:pyruvate,orthophosphate dikinase